MLGPSTQGNSRYHAFPTSCLILAERRMLPGGVITDVCYYAGLRVWYYQAVLVEQVADALLLFMRPGQLRYVPTLFAYTPATTCPVLTWAMSLPGHSGEADRCAGSCPRTLDPRP
eukprot:2613743-Rhodomonas_salina.1